MGGDGADFLLDSNEHQMGARYLIIVRNISTFFIELQDSVIHCIAKLKALIT